MPSDLRTESFRGPSFRFCSLFCSILRRCVGFQRTQKSGRDTGYFIDCCQKRLLVRLRRFVEAADLPDELERSSSDLLISDRWIEVEQSFDIPAHYMTPRYRTLKRPLRARKFRKRARCRVPVRMTTAPALAARLPGAASSAEAEAVYTSPSQICPWRRSPSQTVPIPRARTSYIH